MILRFLNKNNNEEKFITVLNEKQLNNYNLSDWGQVPDKFKDFPVKYNAENNYFEIDILKHINKMQITLQSNYNAALLQERQIGNYFFTLEDSFRVMINSDITTAQQMGITQINGIKDLRGNIINCSIEEAQILYKQLWLENKLLYLSFVSTMAQLEFIKNTEMDIFDKFPILNNISLEININPEQITQLMQMTIEEFNAFVRGLTE